LSIFNTRTFVAIYMLFISLGTMNSSVRPVRIVRYRVGPARIDYYRVRRPMFRYERVRRLSHRNSRRN
jgi:hypothetical protein